MKSQTEAILGVGAVLGVGYLLYKSAKPITSTLEATGEGVGSALRETGLGIGEITSAIGAPFAEFEESLRQYYDNQQQMR